MDNSVEVLIGMAGLAVTALAAFALYRWRQQSRARRVGRWVEDYLSAREGGRPKHLDINCSDKLQENAGPLGALFHGFSVLYCMTTSLSRGGAGLGTVGLPESKLKELATQAGFASVRRVPLENPFNNLYEVTV